MRGRRIDLTGTVRNAAIRLNPPARPGSAHPDRALGGDRSATPRDSLAPGRAGRLTPPQRHNTRAAGEVALNSASAKEQTAGCG